MRKKQKIWNVLLVFFLVAIAAVGFAVVFDFQRVLATAAGWGAGVWNDLVVLSGSSSNTGVPTIGWLKSSSDLKGPCLSGAGYEINFSSGNPGDNERFVSGKAWFGIGSEAESGGNCQDDLPSIGWLDFGAGSPSFCSSGDCHAAQWHWTGNGNGNLTGYLDGWAKITSMSPPYNVTDSGWVRLKGSNYGTLCDSNGTLSGYVWNSGPEDAITGNTGLGWIKTDGLKLSECSLGYATKQLCNGSTFSSCDSSFCTGGGANCSLNSDKVSWTCSNVCGTVSHSADLITTETGVCGPLNGKSLCDPGTEVNDDALCADNTTPHNFSRGAVNATWTCGSNDCGGSEISCSARTKCGWVETNP